MNQLATNMRRIRLAKGISQSNMTISSGFTQSQISDFERGKRTPSLQNLYRIRRALDCPWNELLDKPNQKQK
jgi:transcriptional regulator with XRE-family HTH domain